MSNVQLKPQEEQAAEIAHELAVLRKTLKSLSKNQLIQLVLQQVNKVIEHQNINKVLVDRLKEKEEKNETPT